MSIWLELMILSLIAYVAGLAIGWALWGRGKDTDGRGSHG